MFTELPLIETSTPAERLQALQDAKALLFGSGGGIVEVFVGNTVTPGATSTVIDGFIRTAEYITTGHDYKDTHPEGKRRPIIHNHHTVNVHPVALEVDPEDIPQEIKDLLDGFRFGAEGKPEAAEDEESAGEGLSREDRENYTENGAHGLSAEEREQGLDGK